MNDIIIAGININELKKHRDVMQQDANRFIANAITDVKRLVNEIMEADNSEQAEVLAKEAFEKLDSAKLVSGICDVGYDLPYASEWGNENGVPLTYVLEDDDDEFPAVNIYANRKSYLYKLYNLLGEMENEVRDWNTSTC